MYDSSATVSVLLGLYNGKKYISEQVDSIIGQSHQNIHLYISVDGSDDGSRDIIEKRFNKNEKIVFLKGPGKGFAANFWGMLVNPQIKSDYYSFSDQDDVWEKDKISKAIEFLRSQPEHVPAVYFSRTTLINEHGDFIGESKFLKKTPSFKNALVQCLAGGNTMVINDAARAIILEKFSDVEVASHEWACYLIVSSLGGNVYFDQYPGLRYRQHTGNVFGENTSFFSKIKRVYMLMSGVYKKWNDINVKFLENQSDNMIEENKEIFEFFKKAREESFLKRIFYFFKSGVYRQGFLENICLFFACMFKRI